MHILSNSNVFLAFLLTTFMSVTRASSNVAPEVSAGTKTGILFSTPMLSNSPPVTQTDLRLLDPVGFPPLPSPATTNGPSRVPGANVLALNLTNIQADILFVCLHFSASIIPDLHHIITALECARSMKSSFSSG